MQYHAIRQAKINETFKKGDYLVLFGELFQRGYANGLVEEAERRGMIIVRATVGRREKDGTLRPLTDEESALIPKPFINIPLEAGFDLEKDSQGMSPVERLKDVKLSEWENCSLNADFLKESQKKGRDRFVKQTQAFLQELDKIIPHRVNILFAHLMAGGVPRAKIIMPLMNRSVKGTGDRFLSSEKFWQSSMGQLCQQSFFEVSAETFDHLIRESTFLRDKLQGRGSSVAYLAYGYHGTEILMNGQYSWQTYSPYLQGWAKLRLEQYSRSWSAKGVRTCVYNCPEILTNSSSIFQGVEIPLYALLDALKKENTTHKAQERLNEIASLLKPEYGLTDITNVLTSTLMSDSIRKLCNFASWPQHNEKHQLETLLKGSDQIFEMHKDNKHLMTFPLSEVVFSACGKVMLNDSVQPEAAVAWINHDIIAKLAWT